MSDNFNENLNDQVVEDGVDTVNDGTVKEDAVIETVADSTSDALDLDATEDAESKVGGKKSKKGLIIGLISGGAALIIGAIVLCLCLFVFNDNPFRDVLEMYENSQPSKIVATTTQIFGVEYNADGEVVFAGHKLNGTYTLTVGEVDGKAAAVYESVQDRLGTVEEGGGQDIREPIFTDKIVKEYIEGTGLRITTNGKKGKWDSEGSSLIPERGAIALNISKSIASSYEYADNVLKFTVKEEDTEELFGSGNGVQSDVSVEIITDGVFVIGAKVSYAVPADEENNVSESTIVIEVVYTYDFETISID